MGVFCYLNSIYGSLMEKENLNSEKNWGYFISLFGQNLAIFDQFLKGFLLFVFICIVIYMNLPPPSRNHSIVRLLML